MRRKYEIRKLCVCVFLLLARQRQYEHSRLRMLLAQVSETPEHISMWKPGAM